MPADARLGVPGPAAGPPASTGSLASTGPPGDSTRPSEDSTGPPEPDLSFHGDAELAEGLIDLAVNVRPGTPPSWLLDRIRVAAGDLAAYPDPRAATEAAARRHARPPAEVLVTAGAAEAFTLIARAFRPRRAVIVHPQFTEPEAALRAAGHPVHRVTLGGEFTLDPGAVPRDADLIVVGNPTNPTSVLHPAAAIRALARPGRLLVVDEAFADCVPGEPESLAGARDVPGLIVVRSLTKTWGLAGLRAGYLLASPPHVRALGRPRPPWAVSGPALAAVVACCAPAATAEAAAWAADVDAERTWLGQSLSQVPGVTVTPNARAPFLLLKVCAHRSVPHQLTPTNLSDPIDPSTNHTGPTNPINLNDPTDPTSLSGPTSRSVRERLRAAGFAVRRGDTFPGLGPDWIRIAVRDRATNVRFVAALTAVLEAR
ncbi:MAG: Rv2231c family pyridoxal phosphate-dependent protein CobC [Streptosporangiaceae bacterium]